MEQLSISKISRDAFLINFLVFIFFILFLL